VGIQSTVYSVINSNYRNVEVVVVNDGSTDDTADKVQQLVKEYPKQVKLVSQPNAGKWAALNHGHKYATGDIILTIDADSYLFPEAINNLVQYYRDPKVDAVVGYVSVGNIKTLVGKMQYLEYLVGFHLKRTQHVMNTIHILSGAISSYRARVANEYNLHYTGFSKTEDMDLSLQMRQKRLRLIHAHDAWCMTEGASTVKGLINQRTRWRYGGLLCYAKHKNLLFNLKRAQSLGWYELPVSFLGILQVAVFPLVLIAAYVVPIVTGQPQYALLAYFSLYINFAIILTANKIEPRVIPFLPFVPLFMYFVMLVEFVAFGMCQGNETTSGKTLGKICV
jgi:cellulose synthase/poly-beta-1,6-N-acetylglucosamine synthase-like glycosyltransferase